MEYPNVLNDANIYVDGADWLGKAEVSLPEIAQKVIEYSAFGVSGNVELPVSGHVDKMEGSIKFKSMTKDAANVLYDPSYAPLLDARAAIQKYDASSGEMKTYPIKVTMRAFFKKGKLTDFKQASDTDSEADYAAHYFKLEIDGEEILEIDQFNYIYRVNGKDILADIKSTIGA
jgi:P2 family phage contractile tail tube protein